MNAGRAAPTRFSTGHFVRHYLEMVLAMLAGMAVYGMLFRGNLLSRSYADEAQSQHSRHEVQSGAGGVRWSPSTG